MTRHVPILAPALVAAASLASAQEAPVYPTPQDALETLVAALSSGETAEVVDAIGPDVTELMRPDDDVERAEDWAELLAAYGEGYRFVPLADGRVEIVLGADDWPFPFELERGAEGWSFDVASGLDEIAAREIGLNELDVIDALEAYVEIQAAYRLVDHDGDGVMEFAAHVISTEGTRDGLYWPGEDSPIGDLVAQASFEGYAEAGEETDPEPYLGYVFQVLDGQGPDAPGGEMSYVVNGNQVAGHALLAVPAEYGVTGVMTFMVGENGRIYEADLGEDTLSVAAAIELFNPGEGWSEIEVE
ncbi:DUF2950 family protein [Tropicimonas sediminicola]|uniref:DUF2950 domain-containing protein n=1 Tax=Tropicimonas sediminicola TaxID=1031541 RepID=A0A239FIN8_9RHOB|nr:DUF2950 family protein [Tropicimonas sediminicola]SNS56675.1 Protein of unknown function [Tropicimonas sediminicola]